MYLYMCVLSSKSLAFHALNPLNLVIPMCVFILRHDVECEVIHLSGFVLKTFWKLQIPDV